MVAKTKVDLHLRANGHDYQVAADDAIYDSDADQSAINLCK